MTYGHRYFTEQHNVLFNRIFLFSNIRLNGLTELSRDLFHFLHISDIVEDIPTIPEGMIRIAREDRLYICEGCIDFAAIV